VTPNDAWVREMFTKFSRDRHFQDMFRTKEHRPQKNYEKAIMFLENEKCNTGIGGGRVEGYRIYHPNVSWGRRGSKILKSA
jgi:hypothetical protein